MTSGNGPTVRLQSFSDARRVVFPQIAELRTTNIHTSPGTITEYNRVREVRALAADGRLANAAAAATPPWCSALSGAAFAIAYPVVFARLTRKIELTRGHLACATSVPQLAPECVDRSYDDVEGVVVDLLQHARTPIRTIEAWIASRLNATTVDAYRRRRGELGALQRPRLPRWLAAGLGHDPRLTDLAVGILEWVGVRSTAGDGLWPIDAWTARRTAARRVSEFDLGTLGRDIETVLAVMRTHADWYAAYVERPLGRKQAQVTIDENMDEVSPLALHDRHDAEDEYLAQLAGRALRAIEVRRRDAGDPTVVVLAVLRDVFAAPDGVHDTDQAPLVPPDYEERVARLLAGPRTTDRVVAAVRCALAGRPALT